jgi:hypothetical protein
MVNLLPVKWSTLTLDIRGQNWPKPFRVLGLHFTALPNYTRTVFVMTLALACQANDPLSV